MTHCHVNPSTTTFNKTTTYVNSKIAFTTCLTVTFTNIAQPLTKLININMKKIVFKNFYILLNNVSNYVSKN